MNDRKAGDRAVGKGLTKEFAGFTAVSEVDLDIRHARVHALIGPNGAGKTTVFNLLTKFLQPTRGRITLLGQDITRTRPDRIARMGMVRSFQISAIFPNLTVLENIRVALQRPAGLATQFWLPHSRLDRLNDRATELAVSLGLRLPNTPPPTQPYFTTSRRLVRPVSTRRRNQAAKWSR